MEATIRTGSLKELHSKEKELFGTVNSLRKNTNVELRRERGVTTDGVGTFATAFTSPEMEDNSAWRVHYEVVAFGVGRHASFIRHALFFREGGADPELATGIETDISTIVSTAGIEVQAVPDGNTILIQVKDDGTVPTPSVPINFSVVARIKEVR